MSQIRRPSKARYATVILAGGEGRRLAPLTRDRAKPAVPFGGKYRIIDFVLSNCVYSGFRRVFVVTQYKAQSLIQHLALGWSVLSAELGEFVYAVPSQLRIGTEWYRGTADAVYQNLVHLDEIRPVHVLVLSADHIYRMDYARLAAFHEEHSADATLACIPHPRADASRFGIVRTDEDLRTTSFLEKPADPPSMPGDAGRSLVNMGIYIFRYEVLRRLLLEESKRKESAYDFGRDILPRMVAEGYRVQAWPALEGRESMYWRDIGTIDAYYEANMDLVSVTPQFNLYDRDRPLRTYHGQHPPAKTVFADDGRTGAAIDSLVSTGVIISGGHVERSVLSPEVHVHSHARVEDCVIFNRVEVGEGACLRRCIVDKDVLIPPGSEIGFDRERDERRFTVSEGGVVVISKGYDFGPEEA